MASPPRPEVQGLLRSSGPSVTASVVSKATVVESPPPERLITCGSSQQSAHFAAQGVMAGAYDVVIAAGVEVMSLVPMGASMMVKDAGVLLTRFLCYGCRFAGGSVYRRHIPTAWPNGGSAVNKIHNGGDAT